VTTTTGAVHRHATAVPAAARAWWTIAAVATTISLGMPWRESTLWPMYNVYNPWNCGVDWGGEDWASSQWCFQAMPTYSWYTGNAVPGYQTPIRMFVVLAFVTVIVGVRLGRRPLILLGAAVATAGAVVATTSFGPGQTLYVLGVLALWIGLHRAGLLRVANLSGQRSLRLE